MKKFLAGSAAIIWMTATLAAIPALAQDAPPPPQDSTAQTEEAQPDPNQPGVARVSFIRGDVSVQRGDTGDWVAVTQNTPLSAGDRISTGQNARAELQLDYANILRMSGNATAKIANLDRSQIQIQVGQGLVTYSVLKGTEATAEIDSPNVAVRPLLGEGEYRIVVNSDAETQVTVRRGSADIATPQGSTRVDSGQVITIQGTDNPQYQTAQAYAADDWDRWVGERDGSITHAQSWNHTNHYYTGSEDLDNHGTWSEVPDYGPVWRPTAAPDWTPYSSGRWVYEPYYGWTWVSYEPWGWAPYHYGRWFVYGGDWVWWPGPVAVYPGYYPIWAPAYVSFFGFGGGFGVGYGFGGFGTFGWLPLGPGDWCHPWWGGSGREFRAFGVNNFNHGGFRPLASGFRGRQFSNIRDAQTNGRVRAGLHTMASDRFGREAFNARGARSVSASEFRQASAIGGKMPVTPTKASYSAANHGASPSTIRSGSANGQHFFSASHTNQTANAQASRGAGSPRTGESARAQSSGGFNRPGNAGRATSAPSATPSRNESRSTTPSASANRGSAPATSSRPGWRTFTPPSSANRPGQSANSNSRGPVGSSAQRSVAPPSSRPGSSTAGAGRGGFHDFTPPSSTSRPGQSANSNSRGPLGSSAQRSVAPPSSRPGSPATEASRGGFRGSTPPSQPSASNRPFSSPGSRGGYPSNSGRAPLSMHQPIVRPRGGSPNYGGARPYGNPGGNRGGAAPSNRGGSAPSSHGGSGPRASGGSPRASGGGSHGGGGSRSGGGSHGGHR